MVVCKCGIFSCWHDSLIVRMDGRNGRFSQRNRNIIVYQLHILDDVLTGNESYLYLQTSG